MVKKLLLSVLAFGAMTSVASSVALAEPEQSTMWRPASSTITLHPFLTSQRRSRTTTQRQLACVSPVLRAHPPQGQPLL
jgi:hypothetical protein